MPKRIEYTEDKLGVISISEGTVDRTETLKAIRSITQDKRFPKLKYWVVDMTNAVTYTTDFDDNKEFAEIIIEESRRSPGLLMAFVADTDHMYALSRIFQAFNDNSSFLTQVFQDRKVADEWIASSLGASQSEVVKSQKSKTYLN